ncbi:autotransporter domain-containing protein [Amantichitinum ursilacus]|uniref:autotransporter domain-containing protein n=1 Tax=Amantichitinum ursilacus TaxID=857265 RepID=UPI0006B672E0|nr:autotransporter domain-containing protein [Amantichitinum ursilacus]
MAGAQALATCTTAVNSGTGCEVDSGEAVVISQGGGWYSASPLVHLSNGVTATSIDNNGALLNALTNAVVINGVLTGHVSSSSTGQITAFGDGILLDGGQASSVNNAGSISVGGVGIRVINGGAVTTEGISNTGTIGTTGLGIEVTGTNITGGIYNNGTMVNSYGGQTSDGGGISVTSGVITGSIVNGAQGSITRGQGVAVSVANNSTVTGTITNSGHIVASGATQPNTSSGIGLDGSTSGGGIVNNGTIDAAGDGILVTNGATIQNGGITAGPTSIINANGLGINVAGSAVTGDVKNGGQINVGPANYGGGIGISTSIISGNLINTGTINATPGGGNAAVGNAIAVVNSTVTGAVRNDLGGTLNSDSDSGISITGSSQVGSISNAGTINALGANTYTAAYGIQVDNSTVASGISNSGAMTSAMAGIELNHATVTTGGITVAQGADIAASGAAIDVVGNSVVTGDITNAGTLHNNNGEYGGNINIDTSNVHGSVLNTGGSVSTPDSGQYANAINIATATVDGQVGSTGGTLTSLVGTGINVNNSTVGNGVVNNGVINTGGNSGVVIANNSHILAGGINLGSGSAINANGYGLQLTGSTVVGDVINAGHINRVNGDVDGGGFSIDTNSTVTGNVLNSGTINAAGDALALNHSTVNGNVTNSGTLDAINNSGINLDQATLTGALVNSGTVNAHGAGNAQVAYGIYVHDGSSIAQGISNSGTLNTGSEGIYLDGGVIGAGGIHNTASGQIKADSLGIDVNSNANVTGDINNEGLVTFGSAGYGGGIFVGGGSTVTGNLINSGQVVATQASAIEVSSSSVTGQISNSGSLQGGGEGGRGIDLHGGSTAAAIINSSTGHIAGDAGGIDINDATLAGGVQNAGSVSGPTALSVNGAATIGTGISNTGSLAGDDTGVYFRNSTLNGDLSSTGNSASISGDSYGVRLIDATINGNVISSGQITSVNGTGISIDPTTISGTLTNNGTITAGQTGIAVDASTISGGIINTGTINAPQAILISNPTTPTTVTNSGVLNGAVELANSTLNLNGPSGRVTGAITGTGSTVNVNGTFATENTIDTGTLNVNSGGALMVNNAVTTTGTISNAGTLTNNNAVFAAGPIANAGTINNSGTLGVGVVGAAGSVLNLDGNNAVVEGDITGAGSTVNVNGSYINTGLINVGAVNVGSGGTLEVVDTITAPTVGNNGTLNLDADARVTGNITGGGVVNVNGNFASEGTITAGTVNVAAPATLTLDDDLTGALVNAGNVQNTAVINGAVTAQSGSVLALNGLGSRVTGAISGPGTVQINGTFGTENTINVGNLDVASGGVFNVKNTVAGSVFNVAGTVNNSALIDSGLTLNGGVLNLVNGSRVTGAVADGGGASAINVNGTYTTENTLAANAINISSDGLLNARHNLTGTLTNSGTLDVRSATPITLTGNYVQQAGGVYSMEATSPTQYGQLHVTGTASLPANANIAVDVTQGATLVKGGVLPGVITSSGLTASTFNVTDNSVLFDFEGVIDGNNVDLNVKRGVQVQTVVNNSPNSGAAGGVAGALDAIISNGGGSDDMNHVISQLGQLTNDADINKAVHQMVPLVAGGTSSATAMTLNLTDRVIQAREESNRGLSAGDGYVTDRQMWVKPFGSWAKQDQEDAVAGYDADSAGVIVGVDGGITAKDRAGIAFTYAHTHVSGASTDAPQSASINNYQLMGYGSHSLAPATDLSWQIDYGRNHTSGNRGIDFGDVIRTADSSYNGWNAHAGVGLGKTFAYNANTNLTPSIRADYRSVHNDSYSETGADSLNLNVAEQSTQEFIVSADAKLFQTINDDLSWTANFGAGYDLMARQAQVTSAFVGGGPAFVTYGLNPSPWLFRGGAGLVLHRSNGLEITARYDGEGHKDFYNQTVSVKLRKSF